LVAAIGINDEGVVVGIWAGADNVTHGFILQKGKFTDFDPPDFSNMPGEPNGHEPHGINEEGQIVGYYRGTDGRQHGYLLNRNADMGSDNQ
jgi:probable HAF family extracellular repeat protein